MLDLQYRMHPEISKFPSKEFYNHTLLDGTVDGFGNILSSLYPPSSVHLQAHPVTGHRPSVVFLDHDGYESFKDRSRVNWSEAHIVCTVVEDLLRANPVRRRTFHVVFFVHSFVHAFIHSSPTLTLTCHAADAQW